jgi:Uma2 family endonuclease
VKIPLYGRFGIPEVWIVDLPGARVEVYRAPSPDGYRNVQGRERGEQVAPAVCPTWRSPSARSSARRSTHAPG